MTPKKRMRLPSNKSVFNGTVIAEPLLRAVPSLFLTINF